MIYNANANIFTWRERVGDSTSAAAVNEIIITFPV